MFPLCEILARMSAGHVRTLPLALSFVMCEQSEMDKPTVTELSRAASISKGYASDILNAKQPPSRPLAIHILRTTGWRHSLLDGLSDDELATLERIDPWSPKQADAA